MKDNTKTKITELRYISNLLYSEMKNNKAYIINGNILSVEDKFLLEDAYRDIEDIANLFTFFESRL